MRIYAPLDSTGGIRGDQPVYWHACVAQVDCPLLYVCAVTGRNSWDTAHFEGIFSTADCIFEGDQFNELNEHLSDRLAVLHYAYASETYRNVLADHGLVGSDTPRLRALHEGRSRSRPAI